MRQRLITTLAALFFLTGCAGNSPTRTPPAASNLPAAQGRWAVALEGRPVIIVELHPDEAAPQRWAGSFSVAQFTMDDDHSFSGIKGPGGTRPLTGFATAGRLVEFKVPPDVETYTLDVLVDGTALLGWKGRPTKPLVLRRITSDQMIPDTWDAAKIYEAEDGHR